MPLAEFAAPRRPVATHSHDQLACGLIISLVALSSGIEPARLTCQRPAQQSDRLARWTAMYLTSVTYAWPKWRIAAAFGSDRATVIAACSRIEDMRDDPEFDEALEQLEACLGQAPGTADRMPLQRLAKRAA